MVLLGVLAYALEWLQFSLLIWLFAPDVSGFWLLAGMSALATLANSLQITIAGIGVREGLTALFLVPFGVSAEVAVAAAFGVFALDQLLPSLAGLFFKPQGLYRGASPA